MSVVSLYKNCWYFNTIRKEDWMFIGTEHLGRIFVFNNEQGEEIKVSYLGLKLGQYPTSENQNRIVRIDEDYLVEADCEMHS